MKEDLKPRERNMIKFVLSLIGIAIGIVGFLYYLLNNPNFVPVNGDGQYEWMNIGVLIILSLVFAAVLLTLITFLVMYILKRGGTLRSQIFNAIKVGLLLSVGFLVVFLLHFFHILDFLWGISILIVVIIALFVI